MFYSSTTIWYRQTSEIRFHKESRMVYGVVWEAAKTSFKGGLRGVGHVAGIGWTLTKPMRWPIKLAWAGVSKGAEYAGKGIDAAEWGARWAKESGKGVLWNGVGGSTWELANGPLDFLKFNLVYNTRDVLKDAFTLKTPRNIVKAPINAYRGFAEGMSETGKNLADTVKNAVSFKPLAAANSFRKSIGSLLKTPCKTVWKPTRAILDTPIQMGTNIGNSFLAYPKHVYAMPKHIKKAANRVKNAHHVANDEMADASRSHMNQIPGAVRKRYDALKAKAGEKYKSYSGLIASKGEKAAQAATKAAAAH